ncbi:MAG: DUF3568 family protein [Sedimentisphaerales bacterium]|nr:DUF3568 family protein [Sedimentisphaerales bacterium]
MARRIILVCVVLGGLCLAGGCVIVAAGAATAATVAYIQGALEVEEPHPLEKVYAATKKALGDLRMMVTKDTKDMFKAEIEARDVEDKKAEITLVAKNEGITKITIRVGLFGDEVRSRRIYMRIHENLR